MSKMGLIPLRSSSLRRTEIKSAGDRTLQERMKNVRASSDELDNLNDNLRKSLDLPNDRFRGLAARFVNYLIPKKFYSMLPDGFVRFIGEEMDVLVMIAARQWQGLNNFKDKLRDAAVGAKEEAKKITDFRADIQRIKNENWDARRLQEYLADKAGVEIKSEIAELLDEEFYILDDTEREKIKQSLLDGLDQNAVARQELVLAMRKFISLAVLKLNQGVGAYFDYVTVQKPLTEMRELARAFTNTDKGMFVARAAIMQTFQASAAAVEDSIEVAKLADKYSCVSDDLVKLVRETRVRISNSARDFKGLPQVNGSYRALPADDYIDTVATKEEDDYIVEADRVS